MLQQINNLNLEIENILFINFIGQYVFLINSSLKSKLTASLTLVKTYQEKLTSIKNIEVSSTSVQTVPLHLFSQTKSTSTEGEEKLIKSSLCFSTFPVLSFEFDCTNNIINGDSVSIINENKLTISEINSINIQPIINKSNKATINQKKNKITTKPINKKYNLKAASMKIKKNNIRNENITTTTQPLPSLFALARPTEAKPKTKVLHSNIVNTIKSNNNVNNNNNIKKNKIINDNENSLDLIESVIENKTEFDDDDEDYDDEFSEERRYKNRSFSDDDEDFINGEEGEVSLLNDESYSEGNTSMVMSLWDLVSEIENDLTN